MAPSNLASSASSLLPAAQPTVIQQLEQLLTDAHRLEASAASPPSSPSSSSDYLHGPTRIENTVVISFIAFPKELTMGFVVSGVMVLASIAVAACR